MTKVSKAVAKGDGVKVEFLNPDQSVRYSKTMPKKQADYVLRKNKGKVRIAE